MVTTGWIGGEEPTAAGPALPVTNLMLSMRQRGPGDALENALARSRAAEAREARDEAAAARDPDEHAAVLVTRGYSPGLLSQLSQRLGDTVAELADEKDKLEKAARRQERAAREHAAGRVDVFRMQAMMDGDDGDEGRVRLLERRAESLRQQIAEAQELIVTPQARAADAVEEAASRARAILAEVTRQRNADDAAEARGRARLRADRAAFYGARGRRPFASRGAAAEPTCAECAAAGATAEESFLIHSDPQPVPVPDPLPATHCRGCGALSEWCKCAPADKNAGRYQPVRAGGQDYVYDKDYREIERVISR